MGRDIIVVERRAFSLSISVIGDISYVTCMIPMGNGWSWARVVLCVAFHELTAYMVMDEDMISSLGSVGEARGLSTLRRCLHGMRS